MVGTSGNDTFIGDNTFTSVADSINGGAGIDTLRLVGTSTTPTVTNIEIIELVAPAGNFNAAAIAGVTTLGVQSELMAADRTFTISAAQTLALKAITGTANVMNVASATSVLANTISLDAVGNAATGGTAANIEIAGTAVATLNVSTANAASRVNFVDATTNGDFAVSTINITGNQNLTSSVAASSAAKVTIAAGTFTGNLNLDLSATEVFEVTGGTGADRFNFGAQLTAADKVAGGNGIDTLATSTATVDATFAAIVDSKTGTVNNNSGLEVLEFTGAGSYVLDASVIQLSGLTTYSTSAAITGTAGAAGGANAGVAGVAVTGESNAQTFSFEAAVTGGVGGAVTADAATGGAGATGITFAPAVNNGANVLNLSLKGVAIKGGDGGAATLDAATGAVETNGAAGNGADFTNFETVNIVSTGATATAVNSFVAGAAGAGTGAGAGAAGSSIIASTNTTFNISGVNEINLGTINSSNQPITILAGSLSGKMTVGTGTGADVITGGSGVNLITLAGGADAINLSASVAKADVITFTGATATSSTAFASITGFTNAVTTGDKLDTTITTVVIQADVAAGTATGVTNLTAAVTNGIMTFAGSAAATATLANKVTAATAASFAGAANEVLAFEHAGNTYVFAQVGTDNAFDAGTDQLIQLVGMTGLTSLSTTASGANALFIA